MCDNTYTYDFKLAGTLGRGIKWFMFGVFGVIEYIFPLVLGSKCYIPYGKQGFNKSGKN